MATSRLSFTLVWPTYSARRFGLRDSSSVASSSALAPATTRFVTLFLCQNLQRALEQCVKARLLVSIDGAPHRRFGHRARIPEVLECRQDIRFNGRLWRLDAEILQFVPQFDDDALSRLLSDTRNGRQAREIPTANGAHQPVHRAARKNRDGEPRTDSGNGNQAFEDPAFLPGQKAVECQRILANVGVDFERNI